MSGVQAFLGTAATAVVTAVLTTWVTGMIIAPRLDARKARVLAAFKDRDRFSDSILTILASCGRLQAFEIPPGISEPLREALNAERQRWLDQIDEATRWLIDNTERWAGTYRTFGGFQNLAIQYASHARGVMISGRSQADKNTIIREITEPIQEIFFSRGFFRRALRIKSQQQRLADQLARLEEGAVEPDI